MSATEGSCNAIVYAEDFDRPEQMIKKFCKICKKERVVATYLEKTSYYRTRTQIKKQKRLRSKRRLEKEARRRPSDSR
jgi:hypothetical protein